MHWNFRFVLSKLTYHIILDDPNACTLARSCSLCLCRKKNHHKLLIKENNKNNFANVSELSTNAVPMRNASMAKAKHNDILLLAQQIEST